MCLHCFVYFLGYLKNQFLFQKFLNCKRFIHKLLLKISVFLKKILPGQKQVLEYNTSVKGLTFSLGIFPNCLKIATVILVFNNGDQQECNNYRPFSLLSNISKLIKKLLHNRLYSFLGQTNCLFNYQFGFRMSQSTNHHTLKSITGKNRKDIDEKFA